MFEAIKYLSLIAPTIVSRATDKEENKQVYHKYQEPPVYKAKLDENKQKTLKSKYFLQSPTYPSTMDKPKNE